MFLFKFCMSSWHYVIDAIACHRVIMLLMQYNNRLVREHFLHLCTYLALANMDGSFCGNPFLLVHYYINMSRNQILYKINSYYKETIKKVLYLCKSTGMCDCH